LQGFLGFGTLLQHLPAQVAELGHLGPLYYLVVFIVSQQVVVVPVTPLVLAGAYIFEAPLSYALVTIGLLTSTTVGFLLARFVLSPLIQRWYGQNKVFRKMSIAIKKKGFKISLLARMSLLPAAPMTFVFGGLTAVRFRDFFAATVLVSLPKVVGVVYVAARAQDLFSACRSKHGPWLLWVVAVLVVFAMIRVFSRIANKAFEESIEEENDIECKETVP